jgi:hypothetical protein
MERELSDKAWDDCDVEEYLAAYSRAEGLRVALDTILAVARG